MSEIIYTQRQGDYRVIVSQVENQDGETIQIARVNYCFHRQHPTRRNYEKPNKTLRFFTVIIFLIALVILRGVYLKFA